MTDAGRGTGQRLTDEQRIDWLRLIRSESVGPLTFRSLINRFGGASNALAALPGLLAERGKTIRIPSRSEIEREIARGAAMGVVFVASGEPDYSKLLAAIPAAPPVIAMMGRIELASRPAIAMVGARNASATGLLMAERLAGELGRAGFTIVSGLARGIDTKAHAASLQLERLRFSRAGLTIFIRLKIACLPNVSQPKVVSSRRCHWVGNRAAVIFHAATVSFRG